MNRRSSILSDSSDEKSSLTLSSSAQNLNMNDALRPNNDKKLSRQNTFVLEGRPTPENEELGASNDGMRVVLDHLPENLQPYISMHFQMIREENEDLLQMLEAKEEEMQSIKFEHQKCLDDKKSLAKLKKDFDKLNAQHEREKNKTKAMIKTLKEHENSNNGSNKDLIWFGIDSSNDDQVDEKNSKLQERKTNPQTISNIRRSAKMRQRNRSCQTTMDNSLLERNIEELKKLKELLKEKDKILKELQCEHKKCAINEKAHNKLKKDFENIKVLAEDKENERLQNTKQFKTRSSQTSKYDQENNEEKTQNHQLLAEIEEKDREIENLKQENCAYQEKELEYVELKRKYRKLSSQVETEQNIPKPSLNTRGTQTVVDKVVLETNRNVDKPTNKTKPYVSQLESLKTEMESLRKVKLPYLVS